MKKLQKFALLGVLALAGTVSFTSCSSEEDPAIGPDGTRLSTKTEFSLLIPTKDKATTRMSDADAQVATTLTRTMDKLYLIPYETFGTDVSTPIGSIPPLSFSGGQLVKTASNAPTNETHYLFNNVDVPVGTSMFVAYITTTDGTNDNLVVPGTAQDPAYGTPSSFSAGLESYGTETNSTILEAMTAIANATGWATTTNEGLTDLYTRFTNMKSGSYNKVNDLITDLSNTLASNSDDVSNAIKQAITDNPIANESSFPKNLPEGAIAITWDKTNKKFIDANEGSDNVGVGINATERDKYVKPASLTFRVQSKVATATTSQADNYVNTNSWEKILAGYEQNSSVQVNTVSTALQDTLQYAVGRLATKIALTSDFATYFNDTVTVYGADGKTVISQDITPLKIGEGFDLTGVIIGGQNSVKWDFTPVGTENWAIYDGNMPSKLTAKNATATAANSTLVLETKENTPVTVAIQLVNNTDQDINTKKGVIKKGASFYLIGELIPANIDGKTSNVKSGTTAPGGKVFKQDYVTNVIFTISPRGIFNYSYDVIPDLTKDKLELGLSVDLTWEDAATYEIAFGN